MTFWTKGRQQVINYPKRHRDNGALKNTYTNEWFKPSVRMFKNTRDYLVASDEDAQKKYPSYFIENLMFNVPDGQFGGSFQRTYSNTVSFLMDSFSSGAASKF